MQVKKNPVLRYGTCRIIAVLVAPVALALLYTITTLVTGGSPLALDSLVAGSNDHEIVSARTRFAKVYQLSGDMQMMRISADPIHYQDANGAWQEIDTRVVASADANFSLAMVNDDYHAYFKAFSTAPYLVRYAAGGSQVEFGIPQQQSWGNLNPTRSQASGSAVSYKDIYAGADLRYDLSPTQMLEEFIVSDPALAARIDQIRKTFSVTAATWKLETDGSIAFFDDRARKIWSIPAPVLYEQNDPHNQSQGVHYQIVPQDGYYDLVKVLDPSGRQWLADPQRQYPVVIDDTTVLSDANLAGGEGFVYTNSTSYARRTNVTQAYIGRVTSQSITARAFAEWNTTSIPKNVSIQSVGLYFQPSALYGSGNTVNIQKLSNPISSYPNTAAGNQKLYSDIATASTYVSQVPNFNSGKGAIVPLAYAGYTLNTVIQDLAAKVAVGAPFGLAFLGSNETTAYTAMLASGDTTHPDQHPALVVFYRGIRGEVTPIIRPLRNAYYDGAYYWAFFRNGYSTSTGQYYYYSPDGVSWTQAGELSTSGNQHHGEWYDPSGSVLAAFAVQITGAYTNMHFKKGQVSDSPTPTITWGTETTPFVSTTSPTTDGYDFPSAVLDSNKNCWVLARHVTATTTGLVIRRSTDTTCTSWNSTTVLLAPVANGGDSGVGGYLVPLTGGKMYVVYKNQYTLQGMLFDGSTWAAQETIDTNAAFGVYSRGMSVVAIGDVVHLLYIGGSGSLNYRVRSGSWGATITLDSSASFWSPGLSLNASTNTLFAAYRKSSNNDIANGAVYYRKGVSPYGAANWSAATVITSTAYSPEMLIGAAAPGVTSPWSLSTNYSSGTTNFMLYVDGIYGLKIAPMK